MYTPEYKARVRGEEKRKLSLKPDNFWKENYYEKHYGDRLVLLNDRALLNGRSWLVVN